MACEILYGQPNSKYGVHGCTRLMMDGIIKFLDTLPFKVPSTEYWVLG